MGLFKRTRHPSSSNKRLYERSLVFRSVQIVEMGFARLKAAEFETSEEEVITGALVHEMQSALESRDAPGWTKNFSAHEEVRVHDGGRTGKRRLRIDIEVLQHRHGPRPRFRFEAKRLYDSKAHREYLGVEGLECFLDGRYAPNDATAGMIGYVQSRTIDHHATKLAARLLREASTLSVTEGGHWVQEKIAATSSTYRSQHKRRSDSSLIEIVHILLPFCNSAIAGTR